MVLVRGKARAAVARAAVARAAVARAADLFSLSCWEGSQSLELELLQLPIALLPALPLSAPTKEGERFVSVRLRLVPIAAAAAEAGTGRLHVWE